MTNFHLIKIKRIILHKIHEKLRDHDYSNFTTSSSLTNFDESNIKLIKKRLIDSFGRESRSFEVEIENDSETSFIAIIDNLKDKSDDEFIKVSHILTKLLAESQKKMNIPGGYLLLLEAENNDNPNKAIYIVVKAELHSALKQSSEGENSSLKTIEDIFFSPSQKLFKICVFEECTALDGTELEKDLKSKYICLLSDSQTNQEGKPASYFYEKFLGLSIENNAKLQSRSFYDMTEKFIINSDISEDKFDLLKQLKYEFINHSDEPLYPTSFKNKFIDEVIKNDYVDQVVNLLPNSIIKNDTLIKSKLKYDKLSFSHNFFIEAPFGEFDRLVSIIDRNSDINSIDFKDENYTYIKIKGKPFDSL